ncbi:hypothetical protein N7445_000657 [Penicillium cf. griseofulvum]|nr:hypothetical protein N7445_000657 [Penicillium cf. griseofulvum]
MFRVIQTKTTTGKTGKIILTDKGGVCEQRRNGITHFVTHREVSWLSYSDGYFLGVMETVLGHPIPVSMFSKTKVGTARAIITTENLLPLVETMNDQLRRNAEGDMLNRSTKHEVLVKAFHYPYVFLLNGDKTNYSNYNALTPLHDTMSLPSFISYNNFRNVRDPAFTVSLEIMLETLDTILMETMGINFNSPARALRNTHILYDAVEQTVLYRMLRSNGWCPSSNILCRLSLASLAFMYQVEAPCSPKEHKRILIHPSASDNTSRNERPDQGGQESPECLCSPYRCGVSHLDERTYETKHCDGCSGCKELVADDQEISRILRNGNIPLIMSIDENHENPRIELIESGPHVEYVAISHVWSDGLGNVKRSALPLCQILRLSRMIRNLPDTIGCLPDSTQQDSIQQLAISLMAQTYREACAVLVLDSWLLSTNIKAMEN